MTKLPTLFLSHGAPDLGLGRHPLAARLTELGAELPRPPALLVVSAHWIAQPLGLTGPGALETIHDFSGFPPELYRLRYPAQGDGELSRRAQDLLTAAGLRAEVHPHRGLDHGAWVPLMHLYPRADLPVLQVSLPAGDLDACARLGEALGPLAAEGVLLIGSGGSVHNLRLLKVGGPTDDWALEAESWLTRAVTAGDFESILHAPDIWPEFPRAHPGLDHFAPLVVAWAAAGRTCPGRSVAAGFMYSNLGLGCFAFGPAPG